VITARIIMDGYLWGHGGGAEARPVNFARAVVLGEIWHRVDTAVDSASLRTSVRRQCCRGKIK
jgi:hypothetical protein